MCRAEYYALSRRAAARGRDCFAISKERARASPRQRVPRRWSTTPQDEGIALDDIDLVVDNCDSAVEEMERVWPIRTAVFLAKGKARRPERSLPANRTDRNDMHHLAHAYSAFGPCPFEST